MKQEQFEVALLTMESIAEATGFPWSNHESQTAMHLLLKATSDEQLVLQPWEIAMVEKMSFLAWEVRGGYQTAVNWLDVKASQFETREEAHLFFSTVFWATYYILK